MAFSSTLKSQSVAGNIKIAVFDVNFASVTSGDVYTPFGQVLSAVFQNEVSEGQGILTRTGSKVSLSLVNSSDTGTLTVFGI